MKKIVIVFATFIAFVFPLSAQQDVTKVGICDFMRILSSFYRETKAARDYDLALTKYENEVSTASAEITDLENQKLDAEKAGNKNQALALEKTIAEKRANLDTIRRVRGADLQFRADRLLTGPVLKEIFEVIRFIRESQGFALIIRSDGPGKGLILDNIPEIDITEGVIEELYKRAGKAYPGATGQ